MQAVTVSFLTLALGKLWFVFNLRDHDAPRFDNDIVKNGWLWAAIGLCLVLLAAAIYLPILSTVLETVPPGGTGWIVIVVLSALPTSIGLFAPGICFQGRRQQQDGKPDNDSHDEDSADDRLPEKVA